ARAPIQIFVARGGGARGSRVPRAAATRRLHRARGVRRGTAARLVRARALGVEPARRRRLRRVMHAVIALAGALAFDLILGAPPNVLHPVVWMGRLQRWVRKRAPREPAGAFAWGLLMALSGPLVFGGGAWLLLRLLAPLPTVQLAVSIWLL